MAAPEWKGHLLRIGGTGSQLSAVAVLVVAAAMLATNPRAAMIAIVVVVICLTAWVLHARGALAPAAIVVAVSLRGEGAPALMHLHGANLDVGDMIVVLLIPAALRTNARLTVAVGRVRIAASAFGAVLVIAAAAAPTGGLTTAVKWAAYWLVALPVFLRVIDSPKRARQLINAFVIVSALQAPVMAWQLLVDHQARPLGTIGINVGFFAAVSLLLGVSAHFGQGSESRRGTAVFMKVCVVASAVAVVLSLTRAAWLATAFGLLVILSRSRMAAIRLRFAAHLAVVGVSVVGLFALVPQLAAPLRTRVNALVAEVTLQSQPTSNSIYSRRGLWEVGLKMFEQHPLLGIGPDQYPARLPDYVASDSKLALLQDAGTLRAFGPHNQYIRSAAETGIVGVGALAWLLIAIRRLIHTAEAERSSVITLDSVGVAAAFAAFVTEAWFDDVLYGLHLYVLLLLIVIAACVASGGALSEASRELA